MSILQCIIQESEVSHLYEADYNLILSVKWRQLLQFACNQQFINESLFGSRPGKEAMDAKFMRALQLEMTRMTRHKAIFFDNDATSCYDRIGAFIANVISRKYGMNRMVCMVEGNTLAEARYHLKTKLGVSDSFVQHCRAYPIFGIGQGAGDVAFKWLFMDSVLVDIYDKLWQQVQSMSSLTTQWSYMLKPLLMWMMTKRATTYLTIPMQPCRKLGQQQQKTVNSGMISC